MLVDCLTVGLGNLMQAGRDVDRGDRLTAYDGGLADRSGRAAAPDHVPHLPRAVLAAAVPERRGHDMQDDPPAALPRRHTGIGTQDEALLAGLPLFAGMAPDARRTLLAGASVRRCPRHALLFLQGEPAEHFYVVLDGWVKLFRTAPDGQETVIAAIARGESFAEAASFAEGVFPVGAQVAEDARLLVVPARAFAARLERNPALAINMLAGMSRHLRGLVQEIEQRTVKSAAQRLGLFLLKRCSAGDRAAVIDLPTDKGLVAARLGMRPETFSRALAKLRAVGVSSRDRRVAVSDVGALRRYAEGGRARATGP